MATKKPKQPKSPYKPKKPTPQEEKAGIKQELREKIDRELYKLNQDVIINRMSTRDELFGSNKDLDQLVRSINKYEEKRQDKLNEENDNKLPNQSKPQDGNTDKPKIDIKLQLIEREK